MKKLQIGKRTTGLMIAVVLAGVATVALVAYVRGLENKAYAGTQTVSVFVARQAIPAGTTAEMAIQHAAIARSAVPRTVVADDAITSLEQIQGRVAAVTIQPGEEILASRFVTPGAAASTTLQIPAGRQAMSVEVNAPPGGGGFVAPGARINVLGHLTTTNGTTSVPRVQFVLQDIQVLAVGQRTLSTPQQGSETSQATDRVLLTLAVSPGEAEKLGFAIFEGDIYFTLLGDGGKPVKTSGRTARNIFQ
jgi:pilus assembly protein CpaB